MKFLNKTISFIKLINKNIILKIDNAASTQSNIEERKTELLRKFPEILFRRGGS